MSSSGESQETAEAASTIKVAGPGEAPRYVDGVGTVWSSPIAGELSDSFMEYSMSVIVSRAIPDVRDGLKPVQRRILYAMWEKGLAAEKSHQKSASVVGTVMGTYHPHGDSAIYDAMVRLAQDWSMRVPLVDGQGNFGSPDDSPAAARYTEARMSRAAEFLVGDLGEETVDFVPNYSGTTVQPVVLPAKYPNLVVNGAAGIAVGMATNIAPHNLGEVAEAVKLLIADPRATLADLMKKIPGPDFPTGGILIEGEGIKEAYRDGRGTVRMRGRVEIEEVAGARRRGAQLVVKELPYGVAPERFITRTVEAISAKKVEGVTSIADHSDRHSGQRIVLELRAGVNPAAVLAQLYSQTPLEERFSINQVALVGGAPQTVGLKKMLTAWIEAAVEVVERRTRYRLGRAEARLHLVAGLVAALDMIDEVVAEIRRSRSTAAAREKIMKLVGVDETQANYILEMPLRRLVSLERRKLQDEKKELTGSVREMRRLLGSRREQEMVVVAELEEAVETCGDARRTQIISATAAEAAEAVTESVEIADEECVVTLSVTGLVGRDLGGRRRAGADDVLLARIEAKTREEVFIVGADGVAVRRQGYELAAAEGRSRGEKTAGLGVKRPVGIFSETELGRGRVPVIVTRRGVVKRVAPADLSKMAEVRIITLEEGDEVVWAGAAAENADIFMVAESGQVLRTPAQKIRPQGRGAGGVAGMRLEEGDKVIAAGAAVVEAGGGESKGVVAVITDGGRVKASALSEYPTKGRATGGVRGVRLLRGETRVVAAGVLDSEWTWVGKSGEALGATELGRRDGSGEILEGEPVGTGLVR